MARKEFLPGYNEFFSQVINILRDLLPDGLRNFIVSEIRENYMTLRFPHMTYITFEIQLNITSKKHRKLVAKILNYQRYHALGRENNSYDHQCP